DLRGPHARSRGLRSGLRARLMFRRNASTRRRSSAITRRAQGRYLALNKPYDVLCQFTDAAGRATLKEIVPVPGVYPVGRLDRDSEGLLLLTDDGALAHRITDPRFGHPRTYLAQVERIPAEDALDALRKGLRLSDGPTRPVLAELMPDPPQFSERSVPIRFRK